MPIFNSSKPPQTPHFQLGPEPRNFEPGIDDFSDLSSSQYTGSSRPGGSSKKRSSSFFHSSSNASTINLHALKNVGSTIFTKQRRKSIANSLLRRKSSGTLKRAGSSLSLNSMRSKHTAFRLAAEHRSLFFFTPHNPLRRLLITITKSQIFDFFIVFVIFLNCISLALTKPTNSDSMKGVLDVIEWIFTGIFCVEMVMKVIALGFFMHPGSYLRNPWNILDFLIVFLSFLQILPHVNNYSALRSLRALRPLRTVNGIPGLRIIVNALLQSIPPFINVLVLLFFSFGIFGILGVQLWRGILKNRCVITGSDRYDASSGNTVWDIARDPDTGEEMLCSTFWWGFTCPDKYLGKSLHCQTYATTQNPNGNTVSFDHIGWAFMQVFQIYAGEEWTYIMYKVQDAWSNVAVAYFLIVTFFGALFAVNLGLAVINDKFNQVSNQAGDTSNETPLRERIYNALMKRKESAWVMNKLTWLNYYSSDDDSVRSAREDLSELSGMESYEDDSPSPSPVAGGHVTKTRLRRIKTRSIGRAADSVGSDISSSSSDDEDPTTYEENGFSTSPVRGTATSSTKVNAAKFEDSPLSDGDDSPQGFAQRLQNKRKHRRKSMKRKRTDSFHRISSTVSSFRKKKRPSNPLLLVLYLLYRLQRRFRRRINHIVSNDWFTRIMLTVIVINTLFMSIEHFQQPGWVTQLTETANYVFIAIFTVELMMKLYGLGLNFFKDAFNTLDFLVVGASFLELIFSGVTSFSVLRSFRLLRVFKLLSWKSLRKLTNTILKSFKSIFYLSIIFCLFLFIMTLIGMQTFAGKLDSLGPPIQNFNDFTHALVTVFQIVSLENWVFLYRDLMVTQQGDTVQQLMTIGFLVATIILGDFILLNLFLAILLQSFEDDEALGVKSIKAGRGAGRTGRQQVAPYSEDSGVYENQNGDAVVLPDRPRNSGMSGFFIEKWRRFKQSRRTRENSSASSLRDDAMNHLAVASKENLNDLQQQHETADRLTTANSTYTSEHDFDALHKKDPMPLKGRSLFLFPPTFKLRVLLKQILLHPIVEIFFVLCVTISSLMLTVETPELDPNSVLGRIVFWASVFFAAVFTIEMFLKIFVQGVIIISFRKENRVGYFNDPWNVLDVVIVIVSIASLLYTDSRVSAVKALRALRPLRFVNKVRGLKVVITTLFRSIPAIFNVLIVCFLVFIIFGILGVQLFKGKFYHCSLRHIQTESDCLTPGGVDRSADFSWDAAMSVCSMTDAFEKTIIHRSDCKDPMKWVNSMWHFDHLPMALLVLFEVGSIEQWPDISELAVSAVGVDMQPKKDHNIYAAFYFVLFVAIGAMFIVNLFVGVVLSSFNRIKDEEEGSLMLTDAQREWVSTQRLFLKLRLVRKNVPPKNPFRKLFYKLVVHQRFEFAISAVIVLNVVFMAIEHDQMSPTLDLILTIANQVFAFIFLVEAVLKIIGLGFLQYFRDYWNVFDFFVVILSIGGIVTNYVDAGIGINPTILRVFRVFRIFRILRLIKTAKRIRALLETLYYSIPSMLNVMLTVALVSFIYAVIGMNLFYYVKPMDEMIHLANFRGFFYSMLTMVRIATSEDWNGIMHDCMNTENCVGNECGNPWLAIPFFVSYIIICTFVVMNLFVAVILDNFETQMRFEDSALNSTDLMRFSDIWSEFDPKATYTIRTEYLKNLLQRVGPPLGLPRDCSRAELIRKLVSLDIPEHQGRIHFLETLIPLARRVYNVELPPHERKKLERNLSNRFKSLKKMNSTLGYTTGEYFAATYIQAAYRGRQVRQSGAAVIGLELVRTDSGRLRFKIDRRCHRLVKQKELESQMKKIEDEATEAKNVASSEEDSSEMGSYTSGDSLEQYQEENLLGVVRNSSLTPPSGDSIDPAIAAEEIEVDSLKVDHVGTLKEGEENRRDIGLKGLSVMKSSVGGRVVHLERAADDDSSSDESSPEFHPLQRSPVNYPKYSDMDQEDEPPVVVEESVGDADRSTNFDSHTSGSRSVNGAGATASDATGVDEQSHDNYEHVETMELEELPLMEQDPPVVASPTNRVKTTPSIGKMEKQASENRL